MKFGLIGKTVSFLVEGEKPLLAYCINATLHCRSVGKKNETTSLKTILRSA
jgi:hypothetical protein